MNSILDCLQWMSEHMEDKRDLTPQPPTHPVPQYVYEADKAEREAWQAYLRVVNEEIESEVDNPDYERVHQAMRKWVEAAVIHSEARHKWSKEKYERIEKLKEQK